MYTGTRRLRDKPLAWHHTAAEYGPAGIRTLVCVAVRPESLIKHPGAGHTALSKHCVPNGIEAPSSVGGSGAQLARFCAPRDTRQCVQTFLAVTGSGGGKGALALVPLPTGRGGDAAHTVPCTDGPPQHRRARPK